MRPQRCPSSANGEPHSMVHAASPTGSRPMPSDTADAVIRQLRSEALRLWLDWNDAHEQIMVAMFGAKRDPSRMAELIEELDELDQLRWRAVELSSALLE